MKSFYYHCFKQTLRHNIIAKYGSQLPNNEHTGTAYPCNCWLLFCSLIFVGMCVCVLQPTNNDLKNIVTSMLLSNGMFKCGVGKTANVLTSLVFSASPPARIIHFYCISLKWKNSFPMKFNQYLHSFLPNGIWSLCIRPRWNIVQISIQLNIHL